MKRIRYCNICGKVAKYYKQHGNWARTCGSKECLHKASLIAQKNGVKNRKKIPFDKDTIIELYLNQNKRREEIANFYHCSESRLKKYMQQNKITKDYDKRVENMQKTKLERYGNKSFVNPKKMRETCLERFGAPSNLCIYTGIKPRNSSKKEIKWIKSLNIRTMINHYVIKVQKRKFFITDGYDPETNTIYEFLGDYWHGNLELYKPNEINKTAHKRMKTLNKHTFDRFDILKTMGYHIIYIWENDYKQQKSPIKYC